MKRFTLILLACLLLCSCKSAPASEKNGVALSDAFGNTVYLDKDARIVSCYGSFAHCCLLAEISPVGVTEDAISDHGLVIDGVETVGSVKNIDLEKIVDLAPDLVMLSADLSAHTKLEDELRLLNVPYGYFRIDSFDDYKVLMEGLCKISGRDDLFEKEVLEPERRIADIKASIPKENDFDVLLMRVYSTGIKAKRDDNLAGVILKEFGIFNIADKTPSMLESLSLEQIVYDDPSHILVLTMGDEESALAYLESTISSNPVWDELSAIKNGNCFVLPKDLFHYKPNNRWDESYEYIARIFFGEEF